ncbi:ATP-binding protein [Actinoplanes palleronii]|uniref:Histidine kinase/HSP90-like ATPase domain-containing protein n=1 Tax=Actinoplanes palleronii TaxID=113570 RepID=A0ABQ4B9K7_9ACTN|nr:ATP-binding protein [Actinoplanes palleronii]GIE67275.1 hypothetical protein Apa02nite_033830 [Actinoplanes palleronii]
MEPVTGADNTFLVANTTQLVVSNDVATGVTEVRVRGRWGGELRAATARALRACFAENPQAVIVDLAQLSDPDGDSAATWCTGHRFAASRSPGSVLVLCDTPAAVLHRLQGAPSGRAIGLAMSIPQARARLRRPAWAYHEHLDLPAHPDSARRARLLIDDACQLLRLPRHRGPAQLIMSEFVANAVRHAGSDLRAAVSSRGGYLHLAVQDQHAAMPQLIDPYRYPPAAFIERGAGLRFVQAIAHAWGSLPSRAGKVVWATLAVDAR